MYYNFTYLCSIKLKTMTNEEINKGNRLIAKFMGGNVSPHKQLNGVGVWASENSQPFTGMLDLPENLKYHTDWNWIMTVVGKISVLAFEDSYFEMSEQYTLMKNVVHLAVIKNTFRVVVFFVEWYNSLHETK